SVNGRQSNPRYMLTSLLPPHAGIWLTTLPTQLTYRMENEDMRLATRKRLGLLPFDSLASVRCYCAPHTRFSVDPDHFHSCLKFRRTLHTLRHNNIVQVVADCALQS